MDRWAALFADLEGELAASEAAELEAEVRDRARREVARLHLADRLASALGHPVTVTAHGAGMLRGTLADAAPEWLLLAEAPGRELLVPIRNVLAVDGLGALSEEPSGTTRRLTLSYALRALARRRSPVTLTLTDGSTVSGTFDRVGGDFAELAEHPPNEPRRPQAVRRTRTIPATAIAVVRSEV
ncbi:MAG TPA: hypothetical protein VGX28_15085 [Frankiaceae bacterium]|jgi:hypothetical protein|nr:hypothetical protein [Frankiaceae bacterium]